MKLRTKLARRRPTPSMREGRGGRDGRHVEALEDRQYFLIIDAGPYPVTPPPPFSFIVATGGSLYFQDDISPDRRGGSEDFYVEGGRDSGVWRSDGTSGGTSSVSLNWIKPRDGRQAVLDNGRVLFAEGYNFAVLDGASGGAVTRLDSPDAYAPIGRVVSLGGFALFSLEKPALYGSPAANSLWRTDGTAAGTALVRDFGEGEVTEMVAAGGVAHLVLKTPPPQGGGTAETKWATWRSDGTADGTTPVLDLARRPAFGLVPAGGAEVSFFRRAEDTPTVDVDRWLSDGTAGGSRVAERFNPGTLWSESEYSPHRIAYGKVVFSTRAGASTGTELTVDGELVDLAPGAAGSDPRDFFTSADGTLYFSADDGVHGRELWASDGTAAGTRMVADLAPGADAAGPYRYAEYNGAVYAAVTPGRLYRVNPGGAGAERVAYTDARFSVEADATQAMAPGAVFDVITKDSMDTGFTPAADRFFVDPSEFERDPGAVRVVGPDGAERPVRFVGMVPHRSGYPGRARLAFADGRPVQPSENGTYTVELLGGRVRNAAGEPAAAVVIGTFELNTPAAGPDLVASITHVGKPLASAVGGQRVRVSVTVENRGTAPVDGGFYVGLRAVPGDTPAANGWQAGGASVKVKSLAPGASKTVKAVATLPPYGPDGMRMLRAVADASDVRVETDESNNAGDGPAFPFARWTQPLKVEVAPDLGTLTRNDTHTVPVRIENVSGRPFKGTLRLAIIESNEVDDPAAFHPAQPLVRRVDLGPGKSVTVDYPFFQTVNLLDAGPRTLHFQVDSLKPLSAGGLTTAAAVVV